MKLRSALQKFAGAASLLFLVSIARAQTLPSLNPTGSQISPSQAIGTSPSLAAYNGAMYAAYTTNDGSNYLRMTSSTDGVNWTTPPSWTLSLKSGTAPAIAVYNGDLWIAFVSGSNNGALVNGALYLAYTTTPTVGFSTYQQVTSIGSPFYPNSSPSLAVFNNQLWIAAVYNTVSTATTIETYSTSNGTSFQSQGQCSASDPLGYMPQINAQVGMAALNSLLYFGYQTQGGAGGHYLRVCATDGTTTSFASPGNEVGSGVGAVVYNGTLVFSFKDFSSHNLVLSGTANGTTYTSAAYSGIGINGNSEITPAATVFGNLYYLMWTANASGHYMWVSEN